MPIIKHLTRIIGIFFAAGLLYYNYYDHYNSRLHYGYNYLARVVPNFERIKNPQEKERLFFKYLTPYIRSENKFLLQLHNHALHLHQQFLLTHTLTGSQLYWLSHYFRVVSAFSPYKQSTWKNLMFHTDTVPSRILLHYSESNYNIGKLQPMMNRQNNPLLMRELPKKCSTTSMFLNEHQPWILAKTCYVSARLLFVMKNHMEPTQEHYMHYTSIEDAFSDFIWTVNINPAYNKFRHLRAKWRLKNNTLNINKLMPLVDPQRIYTTIYYLEKNENR